MTAYHFYFFLNDFISLFPSFCINVNANKVNRKGISVNEDYLNPNQAGEQWSLRPSLTIWDRNFQSLNIETKSESRIIWVSVLSPGPRLKLNQNVPKFMLPNQTCIFWDILANISGPVAYFSKPIFALKPWAQAGHFEYHKPYKRNKFFFEL